MYRAISPAEWADIQAHGFRPGPPSNQGKWFAEVETDARVWGTNFYPGTAHLVIEVDAPDDLASRFYRAPYLDRIGPARFADIEQLPELNQRTRPPVPVP